MWHKEYDVSNKNNHTTEQSRPIMWHKEYDVSNKNNHTTEQSRPIMWHKEYDVSNKNNIVPLINKTIQVVQIIDWAFIGFYNVIYNIISQQCFSLHLIYVIWKLDMHVYIKSSMM